MKRPASASAAAEAKAVQLEGKPPSFQIERTRSQVVYRSGLAGKGQTKSIKYNTEAEQRTAIATAGKMVAAERKRRKL